MAYWSRRSQRSLVRRFRRARNRSGPFKYRENMKKAPYGYPVRYPKRVRKFNKRHKVVGYTPDYLVSPIDAVPYIGPANKVYRGVKYTRRTGKRVVSGTKAGYSAYKSRGRRRSSPNRRNNPRGKFYYYRGKRYYRR